MKLNAKFLMGVLCVLMLAEARGQDKTLNDTVSKNAVYVELGGRGVIYSIGYERQIMTKEKFTLSITAGVSSVPNFIDLSLPVSINGYFGLSKSKFVLSISVLNGFPFFPTADRIKIRKQEIKEGRLCTPEGTPLYEKNLFAGCGYKKFFAKNKFSFEFNGMCSMNFASDMEYISGKCRNFVLFFPTIGLKLNKHLGQ